MEDSAGSVSSRRRSRISPYPVLSGVRGRFMRLARSRVSAIRSLVTGCVRSRSGMLRPAPPERCCIVPKNSGMATGSKPVAERMPMPTRSASASLARVKLIWLWAARPCAAVTPPSTASLGTPVVAPIRIAASIAAIEAMFARPAFCSERAMWRCVTCAISCASTPASSASLRVAVTRPAFTPMNPPGRAKALIAESRTAKNVKRCAPSCAWLDRRMPSACRYSLISGSSTIWPASRSCRTIMSPILYSSASDSVVLAGVPMSGSSLPVVCARAAGRRAASCRTRTVISARIGHFLAGIPFRPCAARMVRSERFGGEIGKPRALAAHQRDVARVLPAAEAVDDVGQSGRRLGEVGRVDLRDVAEAHELGAGPCARDESLHLLRREVLRLVEDQVAVQEGAAAHEVERADLDAVTQQVLGRGAAPAAAFLALGQHLEVVHQGAHPRLHLLFLGAGQEADVLAERDRHARHDDLAEAVGVERLREARREGQQRLARASGPEDRHEVDVRVEQQVQREVLLAVARGDAPHGVALAAVVLSHLERGDFALDLAHDRLEAVVLG